MINDREKIEFFKEKKRYQNRKKASPACLRIRMRSQFLPTYLPTCLSIYLACDNRSLHLSISFKIISSSCGDDKPFASQDEEIQKKKKRTLVSCINTDTQQHYLAPLFTVTK